MSSQHQIVAREVVCEHFLYMELLMGFQLWRPYFVDIFLD